jgi:hypothetical protein
VLRRQDRQGDPLLRLSILLAALALAASGQAATPSDSAKLAKALKTTMASFYTSKGSDDVFPKVTCVLAPMATTGHCKAYFTSASLREKGWFDVTASVNRTGGVGRWQATKATCKNSKTGAPVGC